MQIRRKQVGFSVTEFLVATVITAIVLGAAYQTVRLQWSAVKKSSNSAKSSGEAKRVLAIVSKRLRNSGYNPLSVPYSIDENLSQRIGIVSAYADKISFSQDVMSDIGQTPDGIIATTATLDKTWMPSEDKTNGFEIGAFRLRDGNLEEFIGRGKTGGWRLLVTGVERFWLRYFTKDGDELTGQGWHRDPKKLRTISRIDILLKLKQGAGSTGIVGESSTSIVLRNQPLLTPAETT